MFQNGMGMCVREQVHIFFSSWFIPIYMSHVFMFVTGSAVFCFSSGCILLSSQLPLSHRRLASCCWSQAACRPCLSCIGNGLHLVFSCIGNGLHLMIQGLLIHCFDVEQGSLFVLLYEKIFKTHDWSSSGAHVLIAFMVILKVSIKSPVKYVFRHIWLKY